MRTVVLALFAACSQPATYIDADGDGTPMGEDCNDKVASVHPGAVEQCNGVDDDCDGALDDEVGNLPSWYRDADGDGFGLSTDLQKSCEAPDGYVKSFFDCDDANETVNPAADEVCDDAIDNDCDRNIDEVTCPDTDDDTDDTDTDGD